MSRSKSEKALLEMPLSRSESTAKVSVCLASASVGVVSVRLVW